MKYTVHPPPAALRSYVAHLWTVEPDGDGPPDVTLNFFVTCAPCIVFQHRDGRSAITRRITGGGDQACHGSHPTSFIRGPITRPFQYITDGAPTAIGVELKPLALNALLGIDVAGLTDGVVELNAFSRDNLDERLLNADGRRDQIAVLTQFLVAKIGTSRHNDSLVAQSLRLIRGKVGSIHVHDLFTHANVSERQFERRFARATGVPASFYLKVWRFQEAVRLMKAGQFERLSDIAYDLGYADQSHFIKDTREFTGYTPTRLSRALEECAAMTRYRTLIRERVLMRQDGDEAHPRRAA
jgi:AraC-like DNA-binding protein